MDDEPTNTLTLAADGRHGTSRPRRRTWWLRLLIGIVVAALVVGYVVYMSLGMPGMDHSQPAPALHDVAAAPPKSPDR